MGENLSLAAMFQDDEAQEIVPGLYLGPYGSAQSKSRLEELKIAKILTVGVGLTPCFPEEYEYMWIQIEDVIEADLLSHLPSCLKFISDSLKESKNVLVHCQAGMSRSASVCIAYVCSTMKLSVDEGIKYVKSKRPVIWPNPGFVHQLRTFEAMDFTFEGTKPIHTAYQFVQLLSSTPQSITIPPNLLKLKQLEFGFFSGRITDDAIPVIAKLVGLEVLDLSGSRIGMSKGKQLYMLNQLKNLKSLNLSNTNFEDHHATAILPSLQRLESLDLSFTTTTDATTKHIMQLPFLTSLVTSALVTDATIEMLSKTNLSCCALKKLVLCHSYVGVGCIENLSKLTSLETLDISHTKISNVPLPSLSFIQNLIQ